MAAFPKLLLGLLLLCSLDGALSGSLRVRDLKRKGNAGTGNRMGDSGLNQSPIVYPSSTNSGRVVAGSPVLTQLPDGTISFYCNGAPCEGEATATPTTAAPSTAAPTTPGNSTNGNSTTTSPGGNSTVAPVTNNTTSNTTRSGGGGLGLDLSALTSDQKVNVLTINCQLKFEFFTGNSGEPTPAEIDSVVSETKSFFNGVLAADPKFSSSFKSFTVENITPKYTDGDAQDDFELDFTALIGVSSTSLSNQDAATTMRDGDFKNYISNFVWETPPLKMSQFYQTHVVTFTATGTARV